MELTRHYNKAGELAFSFAKNGGIPLENQGNLLKIHPIKRNKIQKLCEYLSQYSFVEKAIVFGSSIAEYCTEESDIDLCLKIRQGRNNRQYIRMYGEIPLVLDDLCDILIYDRLSDDWKNRIDKTGVIIYESETCRSGF